MKKSGWIECIEETDRVKIRICMPYSKRKETPTIRNSAEKQFETMKENGLVKSSNLKPLIRSSFDVRTFCGGGVALEIDADLSWIILDSEKKQTKNNAKLVVRFYWLRLKLINVENKLIWKLVCWTTFVIPNISCISWCISIESLNFKTVFFFPFCT